MSGVEGFDPSQLRVNFTDKEAASKAFEDLPVGKYDAYITEVEVKQPSSGDNTDKYYYSFTAKVDGGPHDGRSLFTNAMLWEGALYTISQIMKAIPEFAGRVGGGGEVEIPAPQEFVGKKVKCHVTRSAPTVGTGTKEEPQYPARNQWNGTSAADGVAGAGAKGGKKGAGSLLPK
jgi:hypothetical protein